MRNAALLAYSQGLTNETIEEILYTIGKNGKDIRILTRNNEREIDLIIHSINKLELFLLHAENKVALGASLIIDDMLNTYYNRKAAFK